MGSNVDLRNNSIAQEEAQWKMDLTCTNLDLFCT